MSIPIEQLEIEIQSESTSAVAGIDALSASLSRLSNAAKGGAGLTSVANQLKNISSSLQSMNASGINNINTLASSLEKLRNVNDIKISSSIGNQLGKIAEAVGSLNGVDMSGISELSNALTSLSNVNPDGLKNIVNILKRLPELAQTLNSIDWATFTAQIQQLSAALSPLASQVEQVGEAFSELPHNIEETSDALNNMENSSSKASSVLDTLRSKWVKTVRVVSTAANVIGRWVNESNDYIENLNLFTVSMGEYAAEAQEYAERVSEILGIDPSEWLGYQGVFDSIITGFGVGADKAALMSKNLTQLGYDIASFNNISFVDAMTKLQSGISGELEPLRRLGYDLSVARLQQEAYNLGITKSVSAMTQAEKSQLRYYAIMTQVTQAQGDMARTLNAPANQLRILQAQLTQCARALGNLFLPLLSAILPYAIAAAKAIRYLAECIASFFGIEISDWTATLNGVGSSVGSISSGLGDVADSAGDTSSGLGDAAKAAKKLKNAVLGIDELNIISPDDDTDSSSAGSGGSGSGVGGVGGSGLDIPLPEYDFLSGLVDSESNGIFEKMKKQLKTLAEFAAAVGAAFLAWKISKSVVSFFEMLSKFKGFTFSGFSLGFLVFADDILTFMRYLDDITKNGANFYNVSGLISTFAGMIGDALLMLGKVQVAGAFKVVEGIGQIVGAIYDMTKNGISWDNVQSLTNGLSNLILGLGVIKKSPNMVAIGLILKGISLVIPEIKNIITAIKTGDWDVVNWESLVTGAVIVIVGIAMKLGTLSRLGNLFGNADRTRQSMENVTNATETVSQTSERLNNASSNLTAKLKALIKNLGLGLVIIAEVAVAAMLIAGAIAILGKELQWVADTWAPVIENGETVQIAMLAGAGILLAVGVVTGALGTYGKSLVVAMGIGSAIIAEISLAADLFIAEIIVMGAMLQKVGETWNPVIENGDTIKIAIITSSTILTAIGVVTGALGTVGKTLVVSMGVGTLILAEISLATDLFIAEIIVVGTMLQKVGDAWKPVIQNGDTIKTSILTGTALLVGIGVVTAALGAATVATSGLLPVAIGLGTALLLELSLALISFIDELAEVADELNERLYPALNNLNAVLPDLTQDMSNFVDFMTDFAGEVLRYTKAEAISGFGATVDKIVGFFTADPISTLSKDVEKVGEQTAVLNEKLRIAVEELEQAVELMTSYRTFLVQLEELTDGDVNLSNGMFINMQEVGQNLVTGFVKGIQDKSADFKNAGTNLVNGFKTGVTTKAKECKSVMTTWAKNLKEWFTGKSHGGINSDTWKKYGTTIVEGFKSSISNTSSTKTAMTTWASSIKTAFTDKSQGGINSDTWKTYGSNIIKGFSGCFTTSALNSCKTSLQSWGNKVITWFNKPDGTHTLSSEFEDIGKDVIRGFTKGASNSALWQSAKRTIQSFGNSVIQAGKNSLDENSPSKVFEEMGVYVIEGFNIGLENTMSSTYSVMNEWMDSVTACSPALTMSVDTSELSSFEQNRLKLNRGVVAGVQNTYAVNNDGFESTLETFYREQIEPTLKEIASDAKRQADKSERTIVKLGNKTVADAVTAQKKANGYVFIK